MQIALDAYILTTGSMFARGSGDIIFARGSEYTNAVANARREGVKR